jgi:acid phosphatase (class A)
MNLKQTLALSLALSLYPAVHAQQNTAAPKPATPSKQRVPYYVDLSVLNAAKFLPSPPEPGSPANDAELADLHRIQDSRTPEQAARAKADEDEEDIFVYKTVFGPTFSADSLPLLAAINDHIKNEQGVVGAQLKQLFARPRPFQIDSTLHPVCELTTVHNSYPSGHGLTGYLSAFTLAEMVPEKRQEILARADDYAYQRMVCGVHYRSDIEASRRTSYIVFGYMMATPRFQRDLAAARIELRTKLGLPLK